MAGACPGRTGAPGGRPVSVDELGLRTVFDGGDLHLLGSIEAHVTAYAANAWSDAPTLLLAIRVRPGVGLFLHYTAAQALDVAARLRGDDRLYFNDANNPGLSLALGLVGALRLAADLETAAACMELETPTTNAAMAATEPSA